MIYWIEFVYERYNILNALNIINIHIEWHWIPFLCDVNMIPLNWSMNDNIKLLFNLIDDTFLTVIFGKLFWFDQYKIIYNLFNSLMFYSELNEMNDQWFIASLCWWYIIWWCNYYDLFIYFSFFMSNYTFLITFFSFSSECNC